MRGVNVTVKWRTPSMRTNGMVSHPLCGDFLDNVEITRLVEKDQIGHSGRILIEEANSEEEKTGQIGFRRGC